MRTFIAVAAAIAATSVSFAVATAANQPVAQTSATDKAVVNQLKTLNRGVNTLNRSIGTQSFSGMRGDLTDIKRAIGESEFGTGLRPQIHDLEEAVRDVCNAVRAQGDTFVSCL